MPRTIARCRSLGQSIASFGVRTRADTPPDIGDAPAEANG